MVKPLALTNPVVVSYMSYSVIENIIDVNRYSLSKKTAKSNRNPFKICR